MNRKLRRRAMVSLAVIVLGAALVGCSAAPRSALILDIASSLTPMQSAFSSSLTARGLAEPVVTADGTATLVRQISEGKASDILLSADADSLVKLTDAQLVDGSTVALATNQLVLAVPAANTARIAGIDDLTRPDVKSVRCAPSVPCGKLAAQVVRENNLNYTPLTETLNVSNAVKLIASGEANAGFVYATDVLASGGKLVVIPDRRLEKMTSVVTAAVLSSSTQKEAAHSALSLWASTDFAQRWRDAGFIPLAK